MQYFLQQSNERRTFDDTRYDFSRSFPKIFFIGFLLLPLGLHFGGRVTFNDMLLHDDGILDVT